MRGRWVHLTKLWGYIWHKRLGAPLPEGRGVGIPSDPVSPHHPQHSNPSSTLTHTPTVFGLLPVSNGISRGLIEAGRQLHWGAGCLAWKKGVAGLRGIGPCLWGNAAGLAHWWSTLTHTMYKMQALKSVGSPTWAAGGPGWDAVGVRLAQLRGEQAFNTNQGDLVMDIGLTERALCFVVGFNQLHPSHLACTFNSV